MRMFDIKTNSSELNLILSKPLSNTGVVLGKWLCGLCFDTFVNADVPFLITQKILGDPDWESHFLVILAQYCFWEVCMPTHYSQQLSVENKSALFWVFFLLVDWFYSILVLKLQPPF